jgi:hypothetical protein
MRIDAIRTQRQAQLLQHIALKGKVTERSQTLYGYGFKPVKRYLMSLGLIECHILAGSRESELTLTAKGAKVVEAIRITEAI